MNVYEIMRLLKQMPTAKQAPYIELCSDGSGFVVLGDGTELEFCCIGEMRDILESQSNN